MSVSTAKVDYSSRQERLAEALEQVSVDGMAVNAGPSLTYLTGLHFHLSERPVLALFSAAKPPSLILPEFEAGKLSELAYEAHAFTYGEDPDTWQATFSKGVKGAGFNHRRIGIEPRYLRVLELDLLRNSGADLTIVSAAEVVAQLRMKKDTSEQADMQRAVNIAQNALEEVLPEIKPGMTEKELAGRLVVALLNNGSESEMPFSPIVAAGPNSANPHAVPTERQLTQGDLLIIDWGANIGGYFSDLTRTFVVGEPDGEMVDIAKIVYEANQAGRKTAAPGVSAQEVDRATRAVIEAAGYGDYFTHRTGHGLGMEGHEEPYIRDGNPMLLTPGMTFTIEPGIYLPGRGGVRIEDDVVITGDGLLSFSDMSRELNIL